MPRYEIVYRRDRWHTETGVSHELSAASAASILMDGGRVDVTAVFTTSDGPHWTGDPVPGLYVTARLEEADGAGHRELDAPWSGAELTEAGPAELDAMTAVLAAAQLLADMANAREFVSGPFVTDEDWQPWRRRLELALGAAQARAEKRAGELRARLFELTGAAG